MSNTYYAPTGGGWRLFIRLTPKAGRESLLGLQDDGSGQVRLKIGVTAVPEKGKANAALIKLLAKHLQVAKSRIELVSGETDRNKVLQVRGEGLEQALKALSSG